jgi:hypothetical protein
MAAPRSASILGRGLPQPLPPQQIVQRIDRRHIRTSDGNVPSHYSNQAGLSCPIPFAAALGVRVRNVQLIDKGK